MSIAPKNLATRLGEAMASMEYVQKSGHNGHHNYKFVTDSDVAAAARKTFARHGITLVHCGLIDGTADVSNKSFSGVFLYRLVNPDDPQDFYEIRAWGMANDSQDKGIAKAQTSAHKNMLLRTLNISTGDPADDADSHSGEVHTPPPPPVVTEMPSATSQAWEKDTQFVAIILGVCYGKPATKDAWDQHGDEVTRTAVQFGKENNIDKCQKASDIPAQLRWKFVAELKGISK